MGSLHAAGRGSARLETASRGGKTPLLTSAAHPPERVFRHWGTTYEDAPNTERLFAIRGLACELVMSSWPAREHLSPPVVSCSVRYPLPALGVLTRAGVRASAICLVGPRGLGPPGRTISSPAVRPARTDSTSQEEDPSTSNRTRALPGVCYAPNSQGRGPKDPISVLPAACVRYGRRPASFRQTAAGDSSSPTGLVAPSRVTLRGKGPPASVVSGACTHVGSLPQPFAEQCGFSRQPCFAAMQCSESGTVVLLRRVWPLLRGTPSECLQCKPASLHDYYIAEYLGPDSRSLALTKLFCLLTCLHTWTSATDGR